MLACTGVSGTVAYTVSRRVREIGVRVALGAARRDVLTLVLDRAIRLAATGLAIGLAGALGVGRLLLPRLGEVLRADLGQQRLVLGRRVDGRPLVGLGEVLRLDDRVERGSRRRGGASSSVDSTVRRKRASYSSARRARAVAASCSRTLRWS